jgi:hypothetical protein
MTAFLDPKDALTLGVVQEANRLFFHPLGLALGVRTDDITGVSQFFLWDAREDPEGVYFSDVIVRTQAALDKAAQVDQLFLARRAAREAALGYVIQPLYLLEEPEDSEDVCSA